jgi:hypothetical protein
MRKSLTRRQIAKNPDLAQAQTALYRVVSISEGNSEVILLRPPLFFVSADYNRTRRVVEKAGVEM